jgi:hypothetical protein
MRAMLSGSMSGSFAHLVGPKSEENKIRMIIPVRVHPMKNWDNGHMTNYQKWTKMKVVALNYSFQNQLEFCSKVLLLWRYQRKDFQKCPVLYIFCIFLNENNSK